MSLVKISDSEKAQKGVTLLPNVPTITATQLKEKFEEKSDDLIIPKFNELSDQLMSSDGASNLGAMFGETETTVQGAIDSLITTSNGKQDATTAVTHTAATAVGSATQGVYIDTDGTAKAMSYEVNKDVPADAVFTDHVYTAGANITIEDGVISSTGGGGGGTTDYSALSNKPKINSVELSGNKSLSDLGVPTTLAQLGDDSTHRVVTDTEKSTWSGKSTVSVNQVVSTGTKIATVTVNGTGTDLYAPSGGGGSVNDAYKSVKVGTTTITASGEDTLELKAGSNITLTPNASDKSVTINAAGGGQSTGDMLMRDYDRQANVKSAGGIEAYLNATACSQALLKETVGWIGRNLLPNTATSTTIDYCTFTVNSDKSVKLYGTAVTDNCYIVLDTINVPTGSYILSTGVPYLYNVDEDYGISVYSVSGGTKTLVDTVYYDGKTLSLNSSYDYEFRIFVKNGSSVSNDGTVYPMLRLANDPDDTYIPYQESVKDRLDDKQDKLTAGTNVSITTSGSTTTISATDTTYTSKSEAQSGIDVSLVTTGEKYTWNHKQDALTIDSSPTQSHTNPVSSGGVYTALADKQDSSTAVKHTASTAVGSATQGVYIASDGTATAMTYTVAKSVPADAVFTDHTYESKSAVSGGIADSLCTTGEKYTWNNKVDSVGVIMVGTASASAYAYQQINYTDAGSYYSTDIKGTMYMETTTKTTASSVDTFTFSNAVITTSGAYDVYADVYGVAPSDVVVSSGSMQVKFASSDNVTTVRVYIK